MLGSFTGVKDITGVENTAFNFALFLILHFNASIHDSKNFLSIVDVPLVRLIGPVKFHADIIKAGNMQ